MRGGAGGGAWGGSGPGCEDAGGQLSPRQPCWCCRCFGCGGGRLRYPPRSCFPRCFRCRSHKQREITKFNPPPPSGGKATGKPVTAAGWRCPHTRVHGCARVCTRVGVPLPPAAVGCGDPGALPKSRFSVALQPSKRCQQPRVTGQGGDVPSWVSPSPSHAPSVLRATGIPCSLLCTCHVMGWLPVKPVPPARAHPSPPVRP